MSDYGTPLRSDGGEVPPKVLESRAVEILEYLADGRADDLPYFDDRPGGPDLEQVKLVWDRLHIAFGEFEEITDTVVDEDNLVVTVKFIAGDESLICQAAYDAFGELTGFWIHLADASGRADEFRRSMPSPDNVKQQVSSYASRMKDRIGDDTEVSDTVVRDTAREVVKQFAADEIESVYDQMAPHLRNQVSLASLRDEWESVGSGFKRVESVTSQSDLNTAEVVFESSFGIFRARVTLDDNERIAGLFFRENDEV